MHANYLFLILFVFTSCSSKELSKEEIFRKERDKRIYSALGKFITAMENKGYHAAGIGEGINHANGKQNYLGVTFDIEELPSVDFARKIEVEALQEFQKHVNAEEGIQDYVAEYPYPIKFLDVAFISKVRDVNLCIVGNFEEEIYYLKDEPGKPLQGPAIEVHRESYEDAVGILDDHNKCHCN
jgi:hypothetical protein